MRILFDLLHPGYLQYYDAPLQELARRGHEVEIWFVSDATQSEAAASLARIPEALVGGRRPKVEARVRYPLRAVHAIGDYVFYLDPIFSSSGYLRQRASLKLPRGFRWLRSVSSLPTPIVRGLVAGSLRLDEAAPRSVVLKRFVEERAPDLLVVSPGVYTGKQGSLLDCAHDAGIPTVAAVASWDNLTTKGVLRGRPDRVLVWNDALADEAVRLHHVPPSCVRVTGAPAFDKWFGRSPHWSADAFSELVGLQPGAPYVLFVGSTASISVPDAEIAFVRKWIAALRSSDDPLLRELGVLIRPHPRNSSAWLRESLDDVPGAAVWPLRPANPVDEHDRETYFDSIHHSVAVVGINTTAMVEAAVVGRPVFSVTPAEFADTQTGTVHFKHLLPENGGFVRCAASIDEHLRQLGDALRERAATRDELASFVASFVRPRGSDVDATAAFVDELEAAATVETHTPVPPGRALRLLMGLLLLVGRLDRRFDRRRAAAASRPRLGAVEGTARVVAARWRSRARWKSGDAFAVARQELDRGLTPPNLRDAYAARLGQADERYAAGDVAGAAQLLLAALRLAFHPVAHRDSLLSPLARAPADFTRPLRSSAVVRALTAPRGRSSRPRRPPAGEPHRLLVVSKGGLDFFAPALDDFEAAGLIEVRRLDIRRDPATAELLRPQARLLEAALGGQSEFMQELEGALRPLLDWADIAWVEWCSVAAHVLTLVDPADSRIVVRLHGGEFFRPWLHVLDASRVDDLVFVSRHMRSLATSAVPRLLGEGAPRLHALHNAVDLGSFARPKESGARFVVGVVGVGQIAKDPLWALEVIRRVRARDDRYRLVLVGREIDPAKSAATDRYVRELAAAAAPLEESGALQRLGPRDDVPELLRGMGTILSSSVRESAHIAVMEGAASGAVPVVRDWPMFAGRPESARTLYPDEWIVETADEAAERILAVTRDEARWRELGAAASARALATWDWRVVRPAYEELLTGGRE